MTETGKNTGSRQARPPSKLPSSTRAADDSGSPRLSKRTSPSARQANRRPIHLTDGLGRALEALSDGTLGSRLFRVLWKFLLILARKTCYSAAPTGPDGWPAHEQAEDLASECLCNLIGRNARIDGLSDHEAAAYLATTVRNLAASWSRYAHGLVDEARRSGVLASVTVLVSGGVEVEDAVALSELSHAALDSLEGDRRTGSRLALVACLQFLEGWTDRELSAFPVYRSKVGGRRSPGEDLRPNARKDAERARKFLIEAVKELVRPADAATPSRREQGAGSREQIRHDRESS